MTTEFEKFLADQKKSPSRQGEEFVQRKKVLHKAPLEIPENTVKDAAQSKSQANKKTVSKPELEEAIAKLKAKHPKIAEFILPFLDGKPSGTLKKIPKLVLFVGAIMVLINPLFLPIIIAFFFLKGRGKGKS